MSRGRKRKQNGTSVCIGCSDGEGAMQSDLETDNDSGSEEEIRQADAVMVRNAHDNDEDGEMGANSPTY